MFKNAADACTISYNLDLQHWNLAYYDWFTVFQIVSLKTQSTCCDKCFCQELSQRAINSSLVNRSLRANPVRRWSLTPGVGGKTLEDATQVGRCHPPQSTSAALDCLCARWKVRSPHNNFLASCGFLSAAKRNQASFLLWRCIWLKTMSLTRLEINLEVLVVIVRNTLQHFLFYGIKEP